MTVTHTAEPAGSATTKTSRERRDTCETHTSRTRGHDTTHYTTHETLTHASSIVQPTTPAMISSHDPRAPHLVLGPPFLAVKLFVFFRLSSQMAAAAAACCVLSLSRTDFEAFLLEAIVDIWLWCVHTFSDLAKNGSYVAAGKHSQSARRQVQCLLDQCVLHTWSGSGRRGIGWLVLQQWCAWWRLGAP